MGSPSLADSTIVAAIVSAVISFLVLIISNFVIQPRRWKQNIAVRNVEKRLEVYGSLLTILKSLAEKGKRQHKEGDVKMYRMENPYDYRRMVGLFERYNYLLSSAVSQSWLDFISSDTFFQVFSSMEKGERLLSVDLSKMEKLVEAEYEELKAQYHSLTGMKL